MSDRNSTTRRVVLGAAAAGAGAAALSACAPGAEQENPAAAPESGAAPDAPLANLADVPVGAAVTVPGADGAQVVVAQPQPGTAVAFDAACTHKGCPVVPKPEGLHCPCHNSLFETATGAVLQGPADAPLTPIPVRVQNGSVLPA